MGLWCALLLMPQKPKTVVFRIQQGGESQSAISPAVESLPFFCPNLFFFGTATLSIPILNHLQIIVCLGRTRNHCRDHSQCPCVSLLSANVISADPSMVRFWILNNHHFHIEHRTVILPFPVAAGFFCVPPPSGNRNAPHYFLPLDGRE